MWKEHFNRITNRKYIYQSIWNSRLILMFRHLKTFLVNMIKQKKQPTKLKPILKPPPPFRTILTLKSLLHPLTLNLKQQASYLLRMTQFGLLLPTLPLQFRPLLFPADTLQKLLQHLATISSHKQCLICIFQLIVGVDDKEVHRVLLEELLPLLEVVVKTRNDVAVQWAVMAFVREVMKFHVVEGKVREHIERVVRAVEGWDVQGLRGVVDGTKKTLYAQIENVADQDYY